MNGISPRAEPPTDYEIAQKIEISYSALSNKKDGRRDWKYEEVQNLIAWHKCSKRSRQKLSVKYRSKCNRFFDEMLRNNNF
jgi:hypothetical protein